MSVAALIDGLGIKPAELARRLGVSDGHISDLKSGRRKLSLALAEKLERATGRTDIIEIVVAETRANSSRIGSPP